MRLIDGDALKERVDNLDGKLYSPILFEEMVKKCPTIEAEPVKHGRWIFKSRNKLINTGKLFVSSRIYTPMSLPTSEFCEIPRGGYFFRKEHRTIQIPFCSECGNRGGDNEYDISKYCPICGARMDGDKT